jgi:hypothetical protein
MAYDKLPSEADTAHAQRFAWIAAGICAFVSLLPFLYGLMLQPETGSYLGHQYNTDDHMVYSAWMRQAQEGRFLFDNRFAVDEQPGLTAHLYFFVLGLASKLLGLAWTAALAKALFSGLFVILLYRLLTHLSSNNFLIKLGTSLAVVGGGIGFLLWHRFGEALVALDFGAANALFQGLPTDVWQPEAYVFPSMLTNGLFMVSLCLIVGLFWAVLEARYSWKPAAYGFLCFALLMNIHSYDVLLVTLVLAGFLAASLASGTASFVWVGRIVVMGLGAVGPALWFWHVLQNDPVFQERAATPTFSPNFRQVFWGLSLMAALALIGLYRNLDEADSSRAGLRKAGTVALAIGLLALFVLAGTPYEGYWMELPHWLALLGASIALAALLATKSPGWNLFAAWAVVGLAALYFPALFQRKLSMGLSVPWAVLAAVGLWKVSANADRGMRNLVAAVAILMLAGSSVRWFLREREFLLEDVSRTTVQPVFLTDDPRRILDYLNEHEGREVVLAMPGIPDPVVEDGSAVPDRFRTPYMPDLNPILSGVAGVYTYAGHWSETPDYLRRRSEATRFFLEETPDEFRRELIRKAGITHVVAPVEEAYDTFFARTGHQIADLRDLGMVMVEGSQFRLIAVSDASR